MTPERLPTNVLFVCSRNQWRSPTAEQIFRDHPALSVRSAGTSASARDGVWLRPYRAAHRLSANDVAWADVVLVMEKKHRTRLREEFGAVLGDRPVHVLDIPDEYGFMDPELVAVLQRSAAGVLGLG